VELVGRESSRGRWNFRLSRSSWVAVAAVGPVVLLTALWYRADSPELPAVDATADQSVSTAGQANGALARSTPASTAAESAAHSTPPLVSGQSATPAAGAYPTQPIRIVVPFPAGDTVDLLARVLAEKLAKRLGQTVVVENRPGTRGKLGTEFAAHAPADGYTLLLATSTHAVNVSLLKDLSYDPLKDFASVSLIATVPYLLAVHPGMPVRSVQELIAFTKERAGSINFTSFGTASVAHLAGELLKMRARIEMGHVPYTRLSAAVDDTLSAEGGTVVMFTTPQPALPYIARGKLRALAVTSAKPTPILPDVPPVANTVKGYEALLWYGLLAPTGTDASIIGRLHGDVVKVVKSDDIQRQFQAACEFVGSTPAQFAGIIKSDIAKWGGVIREAGMKLE
jgi:tripartite-type tricarboxylate transporter receptor subunit TctC